MRGGGEFVKVANVYQDVLGKQCFKSSLMQDSSSSLNRKSIDISGFDTDFDFTSTSQDFVSSSGRLDLISLHRSNQENNYNHSNGGFDTEIPLNQKNSMQMNSLDQHYDNLLTLDSNSAQQCADNKRGQMMYSSFSFGDNSEFENVRISDNAPKKVQLENFSSEIDNGIKKNHFSSEMESVFQVQNFHKYKYGSRKNIDEDSRNMFRSIRFDKKETDTAKESESWNGRHRSHRKMIKFLESEGLKTKISSKESDCNNFNSSSTDDNYQTMSQYVQSSQNINSYYEELDIQCNSRTFPNMEEELELRPQEHKQKKIDSRKISDTDKSFPISKDQGVLNSHNLNLDSLSLSVSGLHKDSSLLTDPHFLTGPQLDQIDFQQSFPPTHRDLDVSQQFEINGQKDFELDNSHSANASDDLSFGTQIDPCNANQNEITLPDMTISAQGHNDISLDAYFGTSVDRDTSFSKKCQAPLFREISSTDNDFNFEEYISSQSQRDIIQPYFERSDLPQDMTLYQKSHAQKLATSSSSSSIYKDRSRNDTLDINMMKPLREVSELQKELTKTSSKESMKGIRTPRDLTRALESLQEFEKEEAKIKEQQKMQNFSHSRQQQQPQSEISRTLQDTLQNPQLPPYQQNTSLISSPKKTFQNKHHLENLALAEQHFLGQSQSFTHEAPNSGLLDPSMSLSIQQHSTENSQLLAQHTSFPLLPSQPNLMDIDSSICNKRDLPHVTNHSENADIDNHMLKQMAAVASDPQSVTSSNSRFLDQSSNITSMLLASFLPSKSKQDSQCHHPLNGNNSYAFNTDDYQDSDGLAEFDQSFKKENEFINLSRQSLYSMMKQEKFCDAVLSTPTASIKVNVNV